MGDIQHDVLLQEISVCVYQAETEKERPQIVYNRGSATGDTVRREKKKLSASQSSLLSFPLVSKYGLIL